MKAVRFHYRPGRYLWTRWSSRRRARAGTGLLGFVRLDEVDPPPLPGPDWVRVQVSLSGICGSDLAAVTARDSFLLEPFASYPFTLGHENVGRVAEVGPAVADLAVGDRVVANPMLACAQRGLPPCPSCASGEAGLCRRTTEGPLGAGPMIGYCRAVGGGWSSSFVAHASQLRPVPHLTDEVAVLTDPFVSSLRAVLLHPPAEGDVVLVIGAGSIGALLVRALRLTGWEGTVAVVGRYPFQLELAARCGAGETFTDGRALDWAASLPGARAYGPTLAPPFVEGGPTLVYDTVGSESSVRQALSLTREGGRVVMVGGAGNLAADWTRIWYRQLTVSGVFAYGDTPFRGRRRCIYDIALELMEERDFASLGMVTHTFPLEDFDAALGVALDKRGHSSVKVVFRPGG